MKRWSGSFLLCEIMSSPVSISVMSLWSELDRLNKFIQSVVSKNVLLIVYVVDDRKPFADNDNCLYRIFPVESIPND